MPPGVIVVAPLATSPMNVISNPPPVSNKPSESEISNYAFHLYQQSSCAPGHDLDNWFEATACLNANIPPHRSGARLHHHVNGPESYEAHALGDQAGRIAHIRKAAHPDVVA